MRVLVLGGTGFLGRHIVDALLRDSHRVTLFHRGRSDASAFPDVEHVLGDRADPGALRGRVFDVVIDTSGYEPRDVREIVRALDHDALRYVFVSTISVYDDWSRPIDESSRVQSFSGAPGAVSTPATYGALKAECERTLDELAPGRCLHVRAGLLVGPHDYDARMKHWLDRFVRGGSVLLPGDPSAPVQLLDARDLADWIAVCATARTLGVFNATGPEHGATMEDLFDAIAQATEHDGERVWAPDALLREAGIAPFSDMPFWSSREFENAFRVDVRKAVAAGLRTRPLLDTMRDTLAWIRDGWNAAETVRANRRWSNAAGITPEREQELLANVYASVPTT